MGRQKASSPVSDLPQPYTAPARASAKCYTTYRCEQMGTSRKRANKATPAQEKPVKQGRHRASCTICARPEREAIEHDFVNWKSPIAIAVEYGLADRASIYRHAHALGLFPKRRRNVRAALERIIEKAGDVEATASAVVGAIQAYAKINAQGQWVERSEHVNLNELFERMSREELETYARDGKLRDWFTQTVSATGEHAEKAHGT